MEHKHSARAGHGGAGALRPSHGSQRHRTTNQIHNPIRALSRVVDFAAINQAALAVLVALLVRWLPTGRREGNEYVALNPHRADPHLGSFRINLRTGRWADFATGDKGGDAIALVAFLEGCSQVEAALRLACLLETGAGR